jgi:hypothetical protein
MPERPDEFYVGYLPLPRGHARALRIIVPALLWTLVLMGGLLAAVQRDPGHARWETGRTIQRTGLLLARPYPMLVADPEAPGSGAEVVLLTEMGKRGAQARVGVADGKRVRVTGWRLQRDGRSILELAPDSDAVSVTGDGGAAPTPEVLGAVELRGEFVDSKCYLGAMKPGDGKAHKACAELCIAGGIPPVLVTSDGRGGVRYIVLTGPRLGPATVTGFAGEPVRVRGRLQRWAGAEFLEIERVERAGGVRE